MTSSQYDFILVLYAEGVNDQVNYNYKRNSFLVRKPKNLDFCFILSRNFQIRNSTYINFHSFDREYFDFWLFIGHVTVEFMSTFVPLDRVQVISTQIETAS